MNRNTLIYLAGMTATAVVGLLAWALVRPCDCAEHAEAETVG